MTLPLFFAPQIILPPDDAMAVVPVPLDAEDAKHLRVLRINPGERLALVDCSSRRYECQFVSLNGSELLACDFTGIDIPSPAFSVTLVQGLSKGDKMDDIIRHATEVGVDEFVPYAGERSVVKLDEKRSAQKTERWRKIAKSAAMQSGRGTLPLMHPPANHAALREMLGGFDSVIAFWEEAPLDACLSEALSQVKLGLGEGGATRVCVIIGPEGGLSSREIEWMRESSADFHLVSLGRNILRTETAGVVAPALVLYELNR